MSGNAVEAPDESTCLCLAIRRSARRLTRAYDAAMAPYGLTIGQFSILGHIKARPGLSQSELAELLAMEQSSMSRALGPLVREGLVAFERDTADARRRRLALTAAGKVRFAQARAGWERVQSLARDHLGEPAHDTLRSVLGELDRMPHSR